MPPFHLLFFGYDISDYERICTGLSAHGFFEIHNGDADKKLQHEEIDAIILGETEPDEEITAYILRMNSKYPRSIIIICVTGEDPNSNRFIFERLCDGYYVLDYNSPYWADNLSSAIFQTIRYRKKIDEIESKDGFYKQIFEKNPISMALTIPESGQFVEVNRAFLQVYGYRLEEVIGRRSYDLNIFVSKEERDAVINTCTRDRPSRDREVRVRTKDNRIISGLFSGDILYRDGQELFLTTMKDISDQKEIEEQLNSNNLFIQNILSNISEGIIVYDTSLGYRVWNRYMEILTGIPSGEILGQPAEVFNPELIGDDAPFLISQVLQGITSHSKDLFYSLPSTDKSGWVSVIYTPFIDSSGTIDGVIVSVRDIRDRKNHETHLRSIIDTIPVWIMCLDREKNITLANKKFCSTHGLTPNLVEGMAFENLFTNPDHYQHYEALIDKALLGREVPFNKEMEDPDNVHRKKYLRGRYSPLKGMNGNIDGVVSVIIDITDLKEAQKTVENINAKLHLLSSITRHDMLNSLTAVLGYLAFAIEEKDPGVLNTYLLKAYQTALLIQEQVEFSRDYQDLGVKEPIWHVAKKVFAVATRSLKLSDISIDIALDDLQVYADPLLERVIYNLVDNALRYGRTVSVISSYWREEPDQAIWIIEDNGVGIGEEMKDKIFQKGVGHNTGLGLFLSREILDITGLTIAETGKESVGARFEIRIPKGLWRKNSEKS